MFSIVIQRWTRTYLAMKISIRNSLKNWYGWTMKTIVTMIHFDHLWHCLLFISIIVFFWRMHHIITYSKNWKYGKWIDLMLNTHLFRWSQVKQSYYRDCYVWNIVKTFYYKQEDFSEMCLSWPRKSCPPEDCFPLNWWLLHISAVILR